MDVFEDPNGYKVTATSLTIAYNIINAPLANDGSTVFWQVRATLLNYAPVSNSPPNANYSWARRGITLDEVGPGTWKATITWASLTYQYALKISGTQQQIRCDKMLGNVYQDSSQPAPPWSDGDKGRAIGWDGRTVHGCSIYVPTVSWTESVEIPASQYTFDYEDTVKAINQAPVNGFNFRGWNPGEVIFHGMQAQLSVQNPDYVTASFEFEASQNNSAANSNLITIDNITSIAKDGWDYLDVVYETKVDSSGKSMIPMAKWVYIHSVYGRSDFSGLNIGTDRNLPLWQGSNTRD